MRPGERFRMFGADAARNQEQVRRARRVHEGDAIDEAEVLDGVATAGPGDGIDRHGGTGRQPAHERGHVQSKARSRHAYRTPSSRMTMNMPISTIAMSPSDTKTTAHGYMNTISMSKARKTNAIG